MMYPVSVPPLTPLAAAVLLLDRQSVASGASAGNAGILAFTEIIPIASPGVMRKAPKGGKLHPVDERINRIIASLRARVEHPFRVLKCQFGYRKTRYRGLAKNQAQLFSLFGLGNLFLVRRRLMA